MESSIHSIRYNFLMNLLYTCIGYLFPLITFPYLARVLLAEGNGKLAYAGTIANYFTLVASLGIPTYGIRICAKLRDNITELYKTIKELFIINSFMTILSFISYFFLINVIPSIKEDYTLFIIYGVNIILSMFGMEYVFQALESYTYITVRNVIFKIISVILIFLFIHEKNDYKKMAVITVFATCGTNIINFVKVGNKFSKIKTTTKYEIKKHIKPIIILFLKDSVSIIYTSLDTVMLGNIRGNEAVGFYNFAIKIKALLFSVINSFGTVVLPRLSYYYKNKKEFKLLVSKSLYFVSFIAFLLALFVFVYARKIVLFLGGNDYIYSINSVKLVAVGLIPISWTLILGQRALTALGKDSQMLLATFVGAIIDIILNLLLLQKYGATGAAFSTVIAEFFVVLIVIASAKSIITISFLEYIKFMLASCISICVCLIIDKIIIDYCADVILLGIIYLIFCFLCLCLFKEKITYDFFSKFKRGKGKK